MRPLYTMAILTGIATPALGQGDETNGVQSHLAQLDTLLGKVVGWLATVLLYDFGTGVPLIVAVLLLGGIYYSFYFGWFSIRAFGHAINVVRGLYDDPKDPGEISHFKALTSALSATIGLGNIAGVAVAIGTGGPGALVWMMITAIFGMSSKLASCTLAIMHRIIHPDGRVAGGPMYYLEKGLEEKGLKPLGRILAILFAILCIGGALGGGNMFQSNQTIEALGTVSPFFKTYNWLFGLLLATLVGAVIIGGIRRIATVTSRLVPAMCILYVVSALFIILSNISEVPAMFALIFSEAFTGKAVEGGILGVAIIGITRAAFSNEAGIGSAAIAHSAAQTDEAAREGIVAMIGPFIDTIIICTMTALVVLLTGAYQPIPAGQGRGNDNPGLRFGNPWRRTRPGNYHLPLRLFDNDIVGVLWRKGLGISFRIWFAAGIPPALRRLRLYRSGIQISQRSGFFRPDDPQHGLSQHHRRHPPQSTDQDAVK